MYSYCYVYVFLLLCTLCSVYSVFIVPTGTLRLPGLRFFRAFSSVVRQMPGYNSQSVKSIQNLQPYTQRKNITTLQYFATLHHTSPSYTSLHLSTLRFHSLTLH